MLQFKQQFASKGINGHITIRETGGHLNFRFAAGETKKTVLVTLGDANFEGTLELRPSNGRKADLTLVLTIPELPVASETVEGTRDNALPSGPELAQTITETEPLTKPAEPVKTEEPKKEEPVAAAPAPVPAPHTRTKK